MKADGNENTRLLAARIKSAAQRRGFALAGISPVTLAPRAESLAAWLRNGLGGEMGYLDARTYAASS